MINTFGDLQTTGPVGHRTFLLEEVCQESEGHEHNYDHTTIVINGRLRVTYSYQEGDTRVEKVSREFGQGEFIEIKAGVRHTIKALEPNTLYACVFSHRDFNGLVTQVYNGNIKAYS